jgi:hypothetical protein
LLANLNDADNPIRYAFTEQATQETATFLLGGLPKVRREWKAEAGDDSCCVSAKGKCYIANLTNF